MTSTFLLPAWSSVARPVIGMLHLGALPGSPRFEGNIQSVRDRALQDADVLATGGVHGLMIENFGDVPFFPGPVPAYVVAHMTAIASEVRRRVPHLPLGINVLRNDGRSALAIAHAVGAAYIRVNILCGGRLADQGILQAIAHDLQRDRALLNADVKIFADVDVKHSAPLAPTTIEDEVDDTLHRGLADALVVSGTGTGRATDPKHLAQVRAAAGPTVPIFLGSGVSGKTIESYLSHATGFIVGTSLKVDGKAENPVDLARVRRMVELAK